MKVRDVMTRDVVTATTDLPVRRVMELMSANAVSGIPVVDDQNRPLGIVTEADILPKADRAARNPRARTRPRHRATHGKAAPQLRIQGCVAGEVMTSPAVCIDECEDLRVAARQLSRFGIKRLPVTREGVLSGILSRQDLLKAFNRSDDEIKAEIEDELFAHTIIDAAHDVRVSVRDGVVTLRGTVLRRSTAKVIRFHVDRIVGVVKVVDGLLYGFDDTTPEFTAPPMPPVQYTR